MRIKDLAFLQSGNSIVSEQINTESDFSVYGGNGLRGFYSEYTNEGAYTLNIEIIKMAILLNDKGLQKMDSLHIACAIFAKAGYFLTTDDKVIKKANTISNVKIVDPIDFIKQALPW